MSLFWDNSQSQSGNGLDRPADPKTLIDKVWAGETSLRGGAFASMRRRAGHRIFDFIWLVYSIFFIVLPLQQHSARAWIEFSVAYAIFLSLYVGMVYASSRRIQLLLLLGLVVLGIAYFPVNSGACGMFIYVAAFVPFIAESTAISVATIASVCGIMVVEGWLLHLSPWSWLLCAFIALSVGAGNMMAAQRMRAGMKLGRAYEEMAHLAKVAERERIARDLHDVLGHTLSVVVLKSELAGKLMDRDPERARREIGEVENIARKALSEVRETISGYRAEGLAAEIARAQKTLEAAGVTLECPANPPQMQPTEETVLSLVVREAVTNIVRHAQASHCLLDIQAGDTGTALVLADDGRGGVRQEGNGLRGMRERVESLGGKLRIESASGTKLVIEIPPQKPLRDLVSPA
ncbi:MAG TPA: sensor histidine kinase [Acidobacteriaceae bacterium]|nr:sensor histidine kinase [Acidobacteriaceae bacterium]